MLKTFSDLEVWQVGRKLTKAIYEKTAKFPAHEQFGLTSQMRRASVSAVANIAEGFGRLPIKEKLSFYNIANGSLVELQSHVFIAVDLAFLPKESADELFSGIQKSQALLQGLIRSTKNRL